MVLKIFTKEDAPEMREAKELGAKLETEGFEVEYFDAEDEEVTNLLELYDVYSFPTFIVAGHDGVMQEIWRGALPLESDIKMFFESIILNSKFESLNSKQIQMNEIKERKFEERTFCFAKNVNKLVRSVSKDIVNIENSKQLVCSAGSVGANYIEANEALSRKDFVHRVKISRKEAKETIYWLKLLACDENKKRELIQEATELMKIFGAIIEKSKV